jgi:DNA-binding transcriptional LysR family regulator
MKLNFKQIECFRSLMLTGTVSGAASLMHVSQPNVSRMIKYMETRLGLTLFERRAGRLLPTREAHALFQETEPLHHHLAALDESVKRISRGEAGRFAVGTSPSLGRYVVPKVLAQLKAKYPTAELRVDVLSVSQVTDYLLFGQGECACTIFPVNHPNLESFAMSEGKLVCVTPKNHPLTRSKVLTARSLLQESLIGFDTATPHGAIVQQFFREAGAHPKFSATVRFAETACALVEQGLGIALVDEFTHAGPAFPNLAAVPVKTPSPFRIHLHRRPDHATSILGKEFQLLLRKWPTS